MEPDWTQPWYQRRRVSDHWYSALHWVEVELERQPMFYLETLTEPGIEYRVFRTYFGRGGTDDAQQYAQRVIIPAL